MISVISVGFYLVASILQGMNLSGHSRHSKSMMLIFGFSAICLHGLLLHNWIDLQAGQNLNFFNMLSLTAWMVSIFVLLMSLVKSVEVLTIFMYPVAAVTILLVLGFPNHPVMDAGLSSDTLFHILLSVITFCVLCVAGLLAVLLAIQDLMLRKKIGTWMLEKMPPLVSLEKLLFQVEGFGFILLTVVLLSSVYFYSDLLFHVVSILQKTVLVCVAWLIFAVLLVGRYLRGWRGSKAIYGTLAGLFLLFLAYFGSKIILEYWH